MSLISSKLKLLTLNTSNMYRRLLEKEHPENFESLFTLFTLFWGLLGTLHFTVYGTQFGAPFFLSTYAILVVSILLMQNTGSKLIFIILCSIMVVDGWLQLPNLSNHTILKNTFLLGFVIYIGLVTVLKKPFSFLFQNLSAIGRGILLIMYFFGVFHKLNSDYFNHDSSCAVALWKVMHFPLNQIEGEVIWSIVIYGSLIIESMIFLMLLSARYRHLGVCFGIFFHSFLALSGYAFYAPFSTLTIALHLFFIPEHVARDIINSQEWQHLSKFLKSKLSWLFISSWLGLIFFLSSNWMFSTASAVWLLVTAPLLTVITKYSLAAFHRNESNKEPAQVFSKSVLVNTIIILFFINCITPYLGLKNAQAMNMFANLRLEGGYSNHFILRFKPAPLNYLEDIVKIQEAKNSDYFQYIMSNNLRITYYNLLSEIKENSDINVSFIRGKKLFEHQNNVTLKNDIKNELHHKYIRKWLHFSPVDVSQPKPCALNR